MLSDAFERLFARFSNLMQGAQVEGVVSPEGMVRAQIKKPVKGAVGGEIFLRESREAR